MKEKEFDDGLSKFMPDAHAKADGVTLVPAEVETPIKETPVVYPELKERLHARKPWKPKGRK